MCTVLRVMTLLAALLMMAATDPAAAQNLDTPECQRDLFILNADFQRSTQRLESAGTGTPLARCTAWRQHVDTLRRGEAIYGRCQRGRTRDDNVSRMTRSATEFRDLIRSRCGAG